jgi:hypothetical protein
MNCCAPDALAVATIIALVCTASARAEPPKGWFGGGEGYELDCDIEVKHGGNASGSLKATEMAKNFGTFTSAIRADNYRGKRVRLVAFVKPEDVKGWAGLWMRVDGKEKTAIAFDNMNTRPIKGTSDWTKFGLVLDVPKEAEEIYFGCLLSGKGRLWIDDMELLVVGADVPVTADPLPGTPRQGEYRPIELPKEPVGLDFEP